MADDSQENSNKLGGLRVKVKGRPLAGKMSGLRPGSAKTRWLIIGAILALGGITFSMISDSGSGKPKPQAPKQHFINVLPGEGGTSTLTAKSQAQVSQLKTQVQDMQQQIQAMKSAVQAQSKAMQSTAEALQNLKLQQPGESPGGTNNPNKNANALPLPPPPPPVPVSSLPKIPAGESSVPSSQILEFSPTGKSGTGKNAKVASTTQYKHNPYAGYLPIGFMPITLLNGVDAGTSSETQSNPQPVLARVEGNAILPGNGRYQLKGCFVLLSAYGNMSARRVYARAAELSCLDKQDHLVLQQKIQGYLVDSDGDLGVRGTVINRQGALLAKSLLAGFAAGLGQALNNAQSTVSSSALGSVSTTSGSGLLSQGAFSGGSNAANMLAQFYLKQAQQIFPVIAINAGRKATLVITTGTSLKWHDYGSIYVRKVSPKK